ncbi:chorismate mutase [Desulfovibrio sp. OttesenSCG-928-C06]|nr:chorismate mutase [Desulfovibrio sp. OttesenSCG-928-C06]
MPREFDKKPASGRPAPGGRMRGGKPDRGPRQSLSEEIMSIDDEIISLLARRSRLFGKMRGGKTHAATPAAIKSEKLIRSHWEAMAGKISRDNLFIRQLYSLIQDISIQQRPADAPSSAFNLAPARLPVNMELPGPAMSSRAMLWISLAASFGRDLRIEGLQRSQSVMDFVKAFSQAGASLSWAGADARAVELAGDDSPRLDTLWADALLTGSRQPLNPLGKSLFVGDEPLVFYLLAFLSLSRPGKVRFTAGHKLKSANMTALYKMLPDLGARLSFSIPGSKGLPASLECSGVLPELYALPPDLPLEAVLGLLLAAFAWRKPLVLSLDSLPGNVAHRALSIMEPFFSSFPDAAEVKGAEVHYNEWEGPTSETMPPFIHVAMDPVASAMSLSIPFFTGGEVNLVGRWPEIPESAACIGLLRKAGLKVEITAKGIHSSRGGNIGMAGGIVFPDLPEQLVPLFWAMNARLAAQSFKDTREGKEAGMLLHNIPENADLHLAADFLSQLGIVLEQAEEGVRLTPVPQSDNPTIAARTHGWSSPGPLWTMAFSLGAFYRSNLKLSNPDSATDLIPAYWAMYNSLPSPRTAAAQPKDDTNQRRRIMTGVVIDAPDPLDEDI